MRQIRKLRIKQSLPFDKKTKLSKREKLVDLLKHADKNSPFYAGGFELFLQTEKNLSDEEFFYAFSHLPIVEKPHLEKHYNAFRCTLDDESKPVENHIKDIAKNIATSQEESSENNALTADNFWTKALDAPPMIQSFIQAFTLNGWKEGEKVIAFFPVTSDNADNYIANINKQNKKLGLTFIPFTNINKETVEDLIKTVKKTKPKLLLSTPDIMQYVCHIMEDASLNAVERLGCITLIGGHLLDCRKSFIQSHFPDSDIQVAYATKETGIIAHQKGLTSTDYTVLEDLFYIEQGQNNSIIVTPFHQADFPLIRYRIQDLGRIIVDEQTRRQSIMTLEGANDDYIVGADGYMYCTSFFNNFINELNKALNNPIIDFALQHITTHNFQKMRLNFVLSNPEKMSKVQEAALDICWKVFANYDQIDVAFHNHLDYKSGYANGKIIRLDETLLEQAAPQSKNTASY